jgi:hypothetical protein
MNDNDRAQKLVLDELRSRYSSFLVAFHATDDKGKLQPHLHCTIFNDQKNHPLRDRNEIFNLRGAIGDKFQAAGISFPASTGLKPKRTQAEIHMKEKGQQLWKDDIRHAVSIALKLNDFNAFAYYLQSRGITIIRQTPNSLTFQDSAGRKARLNRLFTRMKNRQDIEARIARNQVNSIYSAPAFFCCFSS